jgi:hypothetical protein
MDSLLFKENAENEVILSKLMLDRVRKKCVAAYPFNTYGEKLIDNFEQANSCMVRTEGRLIKTGRTEVFNEQFEDNIDRGVFRHFLRVEQIQGATTLQWWRHTRQGPMPPQP